MTGVDGIRIIEDAPPLNELWRSLPDPIDAIRDTWPRPTPHFEVVVVGIPAQQGSKKHIGNGIIIENSRAVGPWRECVERASLRLISPDGEGRTIVSGFPLAGPLVAEMIFTMSKPKASPKRRRTWPATRGRDVSKTVRATEDALKIAKVIEDDGLIVEFVRAAKVYPLEDRDALATTGAVIRIWSVDLL